MKKIIILSINEKRLKHLMVAKEQGYYIVVLDESLPEKCQPYVDLFYPIDVTDKNSLLNRVDSIKKHHVFDAVTTFLDKGVEACAWVSSALGLPGNSETAAKCARNKYFMRETLMKAGLPHPRFEYVDSLESLQRAAKRIGYPFIFKPIGATLSKGIFKISSQNETVPCYQSMIELSNPTYDASFNYYHKNYIAEAFMFGKEFSVEGVASSGKLHFLGVTEKWTDNPYFIETQHVFPAQISTDLKTELLKSAAEALQAIGWQYGGFHVEIMLTQTGPYIVEINGRLGGDYITTHLTLASTGISMIEQNYRSVLGLPLTIQDLIKKYVCVSFLVGEREGYLSDWQGMEQARNTRGILDICFELDIGRNVIFPPKKFDAFRLAAVIAEGASSDEAIRRANAAKADLVPIFATKVDPIIQTIG